MTTSFFFTFCFIQQKNKIIVIIRTMKRKKTFIDLMVGNIAYLQRQKNYQYQLVGNDSIVCHHYYLNVSFQYIHLKMNLCYNRAHLDKKSTLYKQSKGCFFFNPPLKKILSFEGCLCHHKLKSPRNPKHTESNGSCGETYRRTRQPQNLPHLP